MKTPQNVFYARGFGKAAPWVDLANSEEWDGFGKRTDHLSDPEWLAAFQKHWKLAPLSHGKSSRLRLPMDFSRSHEGRHKALVQRPYLRQPRASAPGACGAKAKRLTTKWCSSPGVGSNLLF